MNIVYRIIWNAALNTWVVASELSSGRSKRKTRSLLLATALLGCATTSVAAESTIDVNQESVVCAPQIERAADMIDSCETADQSAAPRADTSDYLVVNSTGAAAAATGQDAIGIGTGANAESRNAVAIGSNAGVTAVGGIAIGNGAQVQKDPEGHAGSGGMFGIAIGEGAKVGMDMNDPEWHYAKSEKAIALGYYSNASGELSVALGANSVADEDKSVSVGSSSLKRRITNVEAGTQAHHAATLGQLAGAASALGGGAGFNDSTGAFLAPSYGFSDGSTFNTVGDALGNLDGRVNILESATAGDALIQQDADTGVIGVGNAVGGAEVNFAGTDGDRRVTGVAEGTADNDAVNLGQLKSVHREVETNAAAIGDNLTKIETNAAEIGNNTTAIAENLGKIGDNTGAIESNTTVLGEHADLIGGLDTRVGNNSAQIGAIDGRVTALESGAGGDDLVGQDASTGVIGVGNAVGGAEVNFAGTDGDRRLTGVAEGAADNDAVNLGQLKNVHSEVETNVAAIGDNLTKIETNAAEIGNNTTAIAENLDKIGDNTGAIEANTTAVGEHADLIGGLDTRVGDNTSRIGVIDGRVTALESGAGGDDLVGQDADTGVIGVGNAVGGAEVNFAGTDGDRRLTGVAAGTADNDAVNLAQLKNVQGDVEVNAAAIGDNLSKIETNAAEIGNNTTAIAEQTNLISGLDGRVTDNTRRIGLLESGAGGDDLVGQDPVSGQIGVGTGTGGSEVSFAGTDGDRRLTGVAAGHDDTDAVNVAQLKAVGLVDETGKAMEAVTYDSASTADGERMVSFDGAAGTVLNNVADGLIAIGSRQAVNGGQLARIRDELQGQVSGLEDRVSDLESGTQNPGPGPGEPGPGPGPGEPGHGGEGEGSTAIGAGASAGGKGSTAIGAGASASADGSVAIGEGSVADREGTVSVGSEGAERQITNVAAGTSDTDAANVGQMKQANAETLSAAKDYTDQRIDDMWSSLGGRIDEVERQANKGIAASAALVMTTPYMPGRVTLNAGVASYQGETALGVGVSRWSESGRINFNAGVSAARGDAPLFRVGVGIIFGD